MGFSIQNSRVFFNDSNTGMDRAMVLPKFSTLLTACVLVVCLAFSSQPASGLISVITFLAFLGFCVFIDSRIAFKYLAYLFAVVANIVGVFVVEYTPLYLGELRAFTHFAGSLPLLVASRWLFLVVIIALDSKWGIERDLKLQSANCKERSLFFLNSISIAVLIVVIIAFAHVAPHPSFTYGMDRFDYDAAYLQGVWGRIDALLGYAIIVPLLAMRSGKREIGFASVAIYAIYLFWTGTKFGDFFNILCLISLVFYKEVNSISIGKLRVAVLALISVFLLIISITVVAYSFTSNTKSTEFLNTRLAQQGQLWWSTYARYGCEPHVSDFSEEIKALGKSTSPYDNIGSLNGIYGVMYRNVPTEVVNGKLASGSRYSEAGYASSLYYFGPMGPLLFSVLLGCVAWAFQNGLVCSLLERKVVASILLNRFTSITQVALSMFLFSDYITSDSLFCFAYLFITWLMHLHGRIKPRNTCKVRPMTRPGLIHDSERGDCFG